MRKVKALTLVEVMVAVTIFTMLCVALFAFLSGAFKIKRYVSAGKRNELKARITLDKLSRELQSSVPFYGDSRDFNGTNDRLSFYTVNNYIDEDAILKLNYFIEDNYFMREPQSVYNEESSGNASKAYSVDEIIFYYWDHLNSTWLDSWQDKEDIPSAVKIEQIISYSQHERYIPLFHANMTKEEEADEESI